MKLCAVVLFACLIGFVISWLGKCKKWKEFFFSCMLVSMMALLAGYLEKQNPVLHEGSYLIRSEVGEGSYDAELLLEIADLKERTFVVTVPEQTLSETAEQACLVAALAEIEAELKGENVSLEEIRNPIVIRNSYQNGLVEAKWTFSDDDIFDDSGNVRKRMVSAQGTAVAVTVTLQCGLSSVEHSFYLVVFGEEPSEEEKMEEAIKELILINGDKDGTGELLLPQEIEGHTLTWKTKESNLPLHILFLGILVVFLLPELKKERQKEARKKREECLLQEYPEMINKLTLLLGAGMTIQGAWNRITDMYLMARTKKQVPRNELYEEMLITRHEIESGRGEMRSYEAFGERCGISKYRKFSNFLVQNLRKGSNGICEILEKEAMDVFTEKKNMARKYGEEATTKLLLPMLLMLGIVIFIIMVPAVISFQAGV